MQPVKIFYSYAHEDGVLRAELGKHLKNYRRQGLCEDWWDGEITAGSKWDDAIKEKLRSAHFILCLLSADFFDSDYIWSVELNEALQRQTTGELRIVPIVLRHCDTSGTLFANLQGLPPGMKPITAWPNQDEALFEVARKLKAAFTEFREQANRAKPGEQTPAAIETISASAITSAEPSEVLSVQDENRALAVASTKAFEGLTELITRNPKIRDFVEQEQKALVTADRALQTVVDYKNVHDRLHDLQFKCYNWVFQEARKVEDQIDWTLLVRPQRDLHVIIESLQQAAKQPALEEEDFSWVELLSQAATQLEKAAQELTCAPLQQAGQTIRGILEKWPTVFDTKLCAAAQTLPLEDLRRALEIVRGKMNPAALRSDAGRRFTAGVNALPQLSVNLDTLTDEHNRWQKVASGFWAIDALIASDVDVLRRSWPKLRERLLRLCSGNAAPWAAAILDSVGRLDSLLASEAPTEPKELQRWLMKVRQTYTSCSNESGTRFYQVDLSLKRLCDELREVQMALATLLEELP